MASEIVLEQALKLLEQGSVVGLPTETVYGLAARIDRPAGIAQIFKTKARPFFDPLIVHVASVAQAQACVSQWTALADLLAAKFWPGPLTLVLPKSALIDPMITSGLTTVAVRCPRHPLALRMIQGAGVPLAAPSANRFGRTSPSLAAHVRDEFQNEVFVVDGGPCEVGIESTIVAVQGEVLKLLRPGSISIEQIEATVVEAGFSVRWEQPSSRTEAPGQMQHHYMPAKPLVILANDWPIDLLKAELAQHLSRIPDEVEGVRMMKPKSIQILREISLSADPVIAARELYQTLRETAQGPEDLLILVWPESKRTGPWLGVWDRLRKAASLHLSSGA